MSQKNTGKAGSRDNAELSRVAARYLSGEVSRQEVCERGAEDRSGTQRTERTRSSRGVASSQPSP